MEEQKRLRRLQTFLLAFAGIMLVGTIVELLLTEHWKDPIQIIPFVLCAVGLWVVVTYWRARGRKSAFLLRALMVLLFVGSGLGTLQHFLGNREVALEINPNASELSLLLPTITGRDPLIAPGVLAAAAAAAIAATFAGGKVPAKAAVKDQPAAAPAGTSAAAKPDDDMSDIADLLKRVEDRKTE